MAHHSPRIPPRARGGDPMVLEAPRARSESDPTHDSPVQDSRGNPLPAAAGLALVALVIITVIDKPTIPSVPGAPRARPGAPSVNVTWSPTPSQSSAPSASPASMLASSPPTASPSPAPTPAPPLPTASPSPAPTPAPPLPTASPSPAPTPAPPPPTPLPSPAPTPTPFPQPSTSAAPQDPPTPGPPPPSPPAGLAPAPTAPSQTPQPTWSPSGWLTPEFSPSKPAPSPDPPAAQPTPLPPLVAEPAPTPLPPLVAEEGPKTGSFVDQHGQLSVKAGRVVDQHGQPVRLTGISLFWSQWKGQFWNEDVVRWLRDDWHCNLVRAAMGVEQEGYLEDAESQKERVVTVVEAAIAAGVYVIIDWHEENADQHVEEAKAFFGEMAQRYGTQPNVLFETFNEPTEQSWSKQIKPYHEQVLAVIREHSSNIVILGTGLWSQRVDEAADDPVSEDNVAYTLHFYSATHGQDLRDKAQEAMDKGAALFVTEWGTTSADGDGVLDLGEASKWLKFLEQNGISCANWSICDKDEKSAALKPGASASGGWGDDQLSESGAFVRDMLRSYWNPPGDAVVFK